MSDRPATITVPMTDADGREVGWRVTHPDGVECDFTDGQCTCGRMDLGIIRADDTPVYIVTAEMGLGGHTVVGVYREPPSDTFVAEMERAMSRYTGFSGVHVTETTVLPSLPTDDPDPLPIGGGPDHA